jgi:hypothetical protein
MAGTAKAAAVSTLSRATILPAAVILYFLWFTAGGLSAGIYQDDLMNLWRGWQRPWSDLLLDHFLFFRPTPVYRPLGAFFYKTFYGLFGLAPLPYRLFCFALLIANIGLVYRLCLRLTLSPSASLLAAVLHAYHIRCAWIYFSSGICFDILCFFFYFSTLLWYLRIREQAGWRDWLVLAALHVAALNCKEMAVTIPIAIAAYEWFVRRTRPGAVVWCGVLASAAFVFGRVLAPGGVSTSGLYQTSYTAGAALEAYRFYLGEYLLLGAGLPGWGAILILALWLAAGWRNPLLRVGWVLFAVGMLPIAFIPVRGLDAAYIPLAGIAISLAAVFPSRAPAWTALIAAAILGAIYGKPPAGSMLQESREIHEVLGQLRDLPVDITRQRRILWMDDNAFGDNWSAVFLTYLHYRDSDLTVHRFTQIDPRPDPATYDVRLQFTGGRLQMSSSDKTITPNSR